jgi:hypothetical protein
MAPPVLSCVLASSGGPWCRTPDRGKCSEGQESQIPCGYLRGGTEFRANAIVNQVLSSEEGPRKPASRLIQRRG